MNMNIQIIVDVMIGGIIAGCFSYLSSIYQDNPAAIKIAAYLWGAPLVFFYLLYIVWRSGNNTIIAFTRHAAFGTSLTVVSTLFTLFFYQYGKVPTIIANILLLLFFLFGYFYYELYNKF